MKNNIFSNFYSYIMWFSRLVRNKRTCKNIKNHGKVVLCGNGPSVNRFPFANFSKKGFDFCCVNYFPLDDKLFFSIKPRYYVCIDPAFHTTIDNLTEKEEKLVDILSKVSWPMKYVCVRNRHLPIENTNITFECINTNTISGDYSKRKKKLLDKNLAMFGYQNVIVASIYYFIMSKIDILVLTGVENDWHKELIVDRNNDVYREVIHFYGKELINVTELGQIKKGELYRYFWFYYITLYEYSLMSKYMSDSDTKIYNSCMDSYIDVFEKRSVDDILQIEK